MTGLYVASNPTSLSAQFNLVNNMGQLADTLTRLSTGLKINSGKDDPAGLIASEMLKADITGTSKAITNTQRANSMIATADSSMGQIGNLLNDIKGLIVEGANSGAMSADQIAANQMQINASVEAIDRIAKQTTYGGKKLLDGSMDFSTDNCGGSNTGVSNLSITSANFGTADSIAVNVDVTEAAKRGTLIYNGSGVSQKTSIDITGSKGTETFTFGAGTTNAQMAELINQSSDSTGVQARVEGAAQRGSVTLASAGLNNDIVITANEAGMANGNYSFRIVEGATNDAYVVSDPTSGEAGVVEISLNGATGQLANANGFAGLFDIQIAGTEAPGSTVSITRGTKNSASYSVDGSAATAKTADGKSTVSITAAGTNGSISSLNDWTVEIVANAADEKVDFDSKTAYVLVGADSGATAEAIGKALTKVTQGTTDIASGDISVGGDVLAAGDKFTLGGASAANELVLTYKEGATVQELNDMINKVSGTGYTVSSTLKDGVDGSALIPDVLTGKTNVTTTAATSNFLSNQSANDVVSLINSKLGHLFTAEVAKGDSGTGTVTFTNASATYGDVNLDNGLRFTGLDSGPSVRMVTTNADGSKRINQGLSLTVINPSEADIAAGNTQKILQVNLATDSAGNSISTAQDVVDLFNSLSADKTLGVSAALMLPEGVDPNGKVWVTDGCGNTSVVDSCATTFGQGIVAPTGVVGTCAIEESDIVLLGANQSIEQGNPTGYIAASTAIGGVLAQGAVSGGTTVFDFSQSSSMNGTSMAFTSDSAKAGFDAGTGLLTVFIDPATMAGTDVDDAFIEQINGAIKQNWADIREFTGSTEMNPAEVTAISDGDTDAILKGLVDDATAIAYVGVDVDGTVIGAHGVGVNDAALKVTANSKGTDMAGASLVFEKDDSLAANTISTSWDDKTKTLTIKGGDDNMTASVLAGLLNADTEFTNNFKTIDTAATSNELVGTARIAFRDPAAAVSNATKLTGGLEIKTDKNAASTGANQTGTSSGVLMRGQSDSNERLILEATDVGSSNFVKVGVNQGSFQTFCPLGLELCELAGTDAVATINGLAADADGNNISINTGNLAMSMTVNNEVGNTSFNITGGGSIFQLGSNVMSSQQMRLGIGSMLSSQLGGNSGKLFQLKNGGEADITKGEHAANLADSIVNEAIGYVANTRGRLGAVQKSSLEPNIAMLQDSLVALTEAESSISNADFAEESSNMTRLQLLVQAGMSTLAIANQFPQYAASLVR